MGTYTNKWAIYLPDESETGWGDLMRANLITISEHLGGRLSELGDFNLVDTPQNGDAVKYNATTEQWENCRGHQVGIQNHGELGGLTSDTHGIYLMLDGTLPMGADLDMNFHRIINCQDPLNEGDVVNKRYLSNTTLPFTATQFVISRQVNDPSTIISLEEGDAYIIGSEPVGIWSGHAYALVFWQDAAWTYLSPLKEGKLVYVLNDHEYYRFNGTTWDPLLLPPEHSTLLGLAVGDDHPQYYNELRHHTPSAHPLGDVVPYGELMTLVDTTIEVADLIHGRTLQYIIPPGGVAGTGTWKAVPADNVGHQIHNGLSSRDDIINGKYIADPTTADYQPALKNHPQYLTDAEHQYNTHAFLSDLYVPWVNLPGVSILSPKGIQIGGNYVFKKPDWDGKLEIAADEQSLDNIVIYPDLTGRAMICIGEGRLDPGRVVLSTGDQGYYLLPYGDPGTVLTSRGPIEPPRWEIGGGGSHVNADWLATSGPAFILNKPREFLFVSDVEPTGAITGDLWVDTSDMGIHYTRFIVSSVGEGEGSIIPAGMIPVTIGTDQQYSIEPATGHHIQSVLIDDQPVALEDTHTNISTYTFSNVQENHTIVVNFALFAGNAGNALIFGGRFSTLQVYKQNEWVLIETTSNSAAHGDLYAPRGDCCGASDTIYAYVFFDYINFFADNTGVVYTAEKITIANKGNGTLIGDLTYCAPHAGSCNNTTRALFFGGYHDERLTLIKYCELASPTIMNDFGHISITYRDLGVNNCACCNTTRGITFNHTFWCRVIQAVTLATTENAHDFCTLSLWYCGVTMCANTTTALTVPGVNDSITPVPVESIIISTGGDSTHFADLPGKPIQQCAIMSSKVRAIYAGGYESTGYLDKGSNPSAIKYMTYATAGQVNDFGSLLAPRRSDGTSSNHGGI